MDSGSAITGTGPATEKDILAARYMIARLYGKEVGPIAYIEPQRLLPPSFFLTHVPDEQRPELLRIFALVTGLIAIVTTLMRLITRLYLNGAMRLDSFSVDDWIIIPATITLVGFDILVYIGTKMAGMGLHQLDTTYNDYIHEIWVVQFMALTFFTGSALAKLAILFVMRRLVGQHINVFRLYTTGLIILVTIYLFFNYGIWIFMCGDPRYSCDALWAGSQPVVLKCLNTEAVNEVCTVLHVIFDFLILAGSGYLYLTIDTTWSRKVSLICLIGVGITSCIFSILRLRGQQPGNLKNDPNWAMGTISLFAMIDNTTALLVANLPVLYGFFFQKAQDHAEDRRAQQEVKKAKGKQQWIDSLYQRGGDDDAASAVEKAKGRDESSARGSTSGSY